MAFLSLPPLRLFLLDSYPSFVAACTHAHRLSPQVITSLLITCLPLFSSDSMQSFTCLPPPFLSLPPSASVWPVSHHFFPPISWFCFIAWYSLTSSPLSGRCHFSAVCCYLILFLLLNPSVSLLHPLLPTAGANFLSTVSLFVCQPVIPAILWWTGFALPPSPCDALGISPTYHSPVVNTVRVIWGYLQSYRPVRLPSHCFIAKLQYSLEQLDEWLACTNYLLN